MKKALIISTIILALACSVGAAEKAEPKQPTEAQLWQVYEYAKAQAELAAYRYKDSVAAVQQAKKALADYYAAQQPEKKK